MALGGGRMFKGPEPLWPWATVPAEEAEQGEGPSPRKKCRARKAGVPRESIM